MGEKVTTTDIANIDNGSTVGAINNNFHELADEFDNVLYRDGSFTMEGNLDMNSNRIINVPWAENPTEAVPLGQVQGEIQELQQIATDAIDAARLNALEDIGDARSSTLFDIATDRAAAVLAINNEEADALANINTARVNTLLDLDMRVADAEAALSQITNLTNAPYEALELARQNRNRLIDLENQLAGTFGGWITGVRVHSEGWYIELDMDTSRAGGTFDFSKIMIRSYDWGFNQVGYKLVKERLLGVRALVQNPYPNSATDNITTNGSTTTWRLSLTEQMYDKARIGGNSDVYTEVNPRLTVMSGFYTYSGNQGPAQSLNVTNNSTEPYPLPIAHNQYPPFRNLDTSLWTFAVMGNGLAPQFERPFAAARVVITGVSSGQIRTRLCTAVTRTSLFPAQTAKSQEMRVQIAAADMGGFTAGEVINEDWTIYPWIGDTPLQSVIGAYGTAEILPRYTHGYNCPVVYAYVDNVAGNDTTAVASLTEATALAAPAATEHRALYLAWQVNAGAGRNHLGGITIRFIGSNRDYQIKMVATSGFPPATLMTLEDCIAGPTWTIYETAPGVTGTRLVARASSGEGTLPPRTQIRGFSAIYCAGNTSAIVMDGRSGQAPMPASYLPDLWINGVPYTDDGGTNYNTIHIYRAGSVYLTGFNSPSVSTYALAPFGNVMQNLRLVRDVDVQAPGATIAFCVNGVRINNPRGSVVITDPATTNLLKNDGLALLNLSISSQNGSSVPIEISREVIKGVAMVNVLVESYNTNLGAMRVGGDGQNVEIKNIFRSNVGTYGNRVNEGYEDSFTMTGTGQKKKLYTLRNSVIWEWNIKVDTFATNGANIHTWNIAYKTGYNNNVYLRGDNNGITVPNRTAWLGRVFGPSEFVHGSWLSGVVNNYQAGAPGTSGGGDYTPAAGSPLLNKTTIAQRVSPFDLYGLAWNPNGGALGPIERPY